MEMIRNNRIAIAQCNKYYKYKSDAGTHVNQYLINLENKERKYFHEKKIY
jgi:hypothetical protein